MTIYEQIKNYDDYKISPHQAILNVFYDMWQKNKYESYLDMIEDANNKDEILALAILSGKYHQQVCNGGHMQYFENGYCDGIEGCMSTHDEEIPLHFFISKADKFFPKTELFSKFISILKLFKIELDEDRYIDDICWECDGLGESYQECMACEGLGNNGEEEDCMVCEGSGEVTEVCCNCNGSGYAETDNEEYGGVTNGDLLSSLDSEYYKISDEIEEELEKFFTEYMLTK